MALSPQEIQSIKKKLAREDDARFVILANALGDPTRCKIFRAFAKEERLCVSDIVKVLGISMSSASQHLKIFEMINVLGRKREGRNIYYTLRTDDPLIQTMLAAIH